MNSNESNVRPHGLSYGRELRSGYVSSTSPSYSIGANANYSCLNNGQLDGRQDNTSGANVIRWSSVERAGAGPEVSQIVEPMEVRYSREGQTLCTEQRHRMNLDGDAYTLVIVDCSPSRIDADLDCNNTNCQSRNLGCCQTELNVNLKQHYSPCDHGTINRTNSQQQLSSNSSSMFQQQQHQQLAIEQSYRHSSADSRPSSRQDNQSSSLTTQHEYSTTQSKSPASPQDQRRSTQTKQHLHDENHLYVPRNQPRSNASAERLDHEESTEQQVSSLHQHDTHQVQDDKVESQQAQQQQQQQPPQARPGYRYVKRWNWNQQQFVFVEEPDNFSQHKPLPGPPPAPLYGTGERRPSDESWYQQKKTICNDQPSASSIGRLPTSSHNPGDQLTSPNEQHQQQVYDPTWLVYRQPDMESVQSDPLYRDLLYELQRLEEGVRAPIEQTVIVEETSTQRPVFGQSIKPEQVEVREYENIEFICRLIPISDPTMRVEWTHNGKPLIESSRIVHEHEFGIVRLQIKRCEAEDSGIYQCKATNSLGEAISTASLRVKAKGNIQYESLHPAGLDKIRQLENPKPVNQLEEPVAEQPPKFLSHISDYVEKNEGDSVHFECCLAPVDDPELKTEWFFNGRPLVTGSRFHTIDDFGFIVLDIDWLFPRDTGEYVCRATNKYGSDVTRTVLRVKPDKNIVMESQLENPTVIDKLHQLEFPDVAEEVFVEEPDKPAHFVQQLRSAGNRRQYAEGDNVHFEARVGPATDGNLTVEWFHNDKPLISGHRFKPTFDFGHILLDILYVYPEDSGVYKCVARNLTGTDVSQFEIQVSGKPSLVYHSQLPEEMIGGVQKITEMEASWNRPVAPEEEEEPAPKMAPQFVLRPKPVQAFENSIARFCCRVASNPRARVTWLINGQTAVSGSRYKLTYDGMYHLTIPKCQLDDAGKIEVCARNLLGECRSETELKVKRKVDDYRGVLKNSPKPWYDEQSLKVYQRRRGSQDLSDDEEEFTQSLERLRKLAFSSSNQTQQQLVGYMEPETPDVNLLTGAPILSTLLEPGDLHPAAMDKQRTVMAPAPSTIKRALKDKDSIKTPEKSFQLPAESSQHRARLRRDQQEGYQNDLNEQQDFDRAPGTSQSSNSTRSDEATMRQLLLSREGSPGVRFDPRLPPPSPESKVHGKEVHSHKHKQTQLERRGNKQIMREIIEKETFEQEHKGLTKDNLVRGPSADRCSTPGTDISSLHFDETTDKSIRSQQQQQRQVHYQQQSYAERPQSVSSSRSVTNEFELISDIDYDNMVAPEFVQKIHPCQSIDGDEARFECIFKGDPVPKISWFRDNKLIKESNLYTIITNVKEMKSTLIIRRVSVNSNAVYTVKAENVVGSAKSSANLVVDPHPLPGGIKIHQVNYKTSTSAGAGAAFTTSGQFTQLSPNKMQLSGEPEPNSLDSSLSESISSQVVKSVRKRKLSNEQMASRLRANPDGSVAPIFLHTIHDTTGKLGELVRLDARLLGSQPMEVRWLKDGERIRPDHSHKMVLEGDVYTLLVLECSARDQGEYECVAINAIGEARCTARLVLVEPTEHLSVGFESGRLSVASDRSQKGGQLSSGGTPEPGSAYKSHTITEQQVSSSTARNHFGVTRHQYNPLMGQYTSTSVPATEQARPPKLIKHLEGQQVREGKSVTLRCQISSFPAAEVFWYKSGEAGQPDKLVKPSKYFRIFKDNDETYCLKILETFAEDQGEYKCVARAPSGLAQVETSAQINVLPSSPK